MMSMKMPSHLVSNRLVQESYEERLYQAHIKKLNEIRNSRSQLSHDTSRFPNIHRSNDLTFLNEMQLDSQRSVGYSSRASYKQPKSKSETWNPDYQRSRFRIMKQNKDREIEQGNLRLLKKLHNIKPTLDKKEWEKDFILHKNILNASSNKKVYTPRGIGHRKYPSLNLLKLSQTSNNPKKMKKKSAITMLNAAINRHDAAEAVLIKTMATLNYYERMETKMKYEDTYGTDLKKGLFKVMDKAYEPLIHAFLTDKNVYDAERIYESLYEPLEAAAIISETLLSRYLSERDALKSQFKITIDSTIETEIDEKIEGDLKTFLLNFLKNKALDNNSVDALQIKSDLKELKDLDSIPVDHEVLLNTIKHDSKKQIKQLFDEYKNETGSDILSKIDCNQPIGRAFRVIVNYLNNPVLFVCEKLQKNIKSNKTEFLRLLAIIPKNQIASVSKEYRMKYKVTIEDEIKNNFPAEVSRIAKKIVEIN